MTMMQLNGNESIISDCDDHDNHDMISFHSSSSSSSRGKCCCPCTCSTTLRNQWESSSFDLKDSNGKLIDIKATFAPPSTSTNGTNNINNCYYYYCYGILKTILLCWTVSVVIMEIQVSQTPFWLAYLTTWGLLMTLLCNALNLFLFVYLRMYYKQDYYSTSATTTRSRTSTLSSSSVGWIIIIPWIVSIVTINIGILIMILYWGLLYSGYKITYLDVMKHGLLAILTTIDVIIINRIPIRIKQIGYVYLFQILYFIWSMIHYAFDIGTPYEDNDASTDDDASYYAFDIGTPYEDNDASTDDDAIYPVVNWKKRPVLALVIVVMIFLVVTPLLYIFLWCFAKLFKRRYYESNNEDEVALSGSNGGRRSDDGMNNLGQLGITGSAREEG